MAGNAQNPAAPSPASVPAPDPAATGYDPDSRWTNYFNILTNRMTDAGKDAFREAAYIRNEARDCKRCDEWRDYLLKYSPIIRFMTQNIEQLNGKLDAENVQCRRCPTRIERVKELGEDGKETGREIAKKVRQGGGFSPDHGILICANEMRSQGHLEDTLAHEMVHAWDHLRFKVDWADLRHAACTEIRASALSGECRWTREFFTRNNWTITQQFQNCVRNRAVRSVMSRPSCKDDVQAVKVVNEVWDSCFMDTRPFDEIYK
ncbi:MAG: Mitochondrial inner membrane protease atp23 [Claussenomyces sp. TS43310]|nr:MAG: Mitochondrial inner membrane protease atp23 [Claussenomyces sp. TS43310]